MSQSGISKKIFLITVLPVLLIAVMLSTYFINSQFSYITETLNRRGEFIAKQLAPAAEFSVYSGNTEFISPLIKSIINNKDVTRIQILDKNKKSILDEKDSHSTQSIKPSIIEHFITPYENIVFRESILSNTIPLNDYEALNKDSAVNQVGEIIVTLTTHYATLEKIAHIKNSVLLTLVMILLTTLIVMRISRHITQPVKELTETVRSIAAGNLEINIRENATGEIGILQSCINHMTNELKLSQSDMENQLNEYTNELQETLEELEIRNAELDITRSKAISANKAKSEFLANMSHEIRTPLSGIIGFTELLHGTSLSEQQADYTDTIRKSANNLLEIINDILDLSKIESGKTEISKSEFNLRDIIEDIINLLTPTAYEKNIDLFYSINNDVPVIIQADPFRIHQIITNLVGNAIKFTQIGYVYLQVSRGEIDNTDHSIKFTVADTGIGMSQSDKKKLFKAFTQADTTITRRFGGTGLGLVISRKLTLLMNGEIGFDSTLGEGSTFWFSVPVTPVLDNNIESTESTTLKNMNIAFVATHIIVKQVYKNLMESWNCHFHLFNPEDLPTLAQSGSHYDALIVYLGRKDFDNQAFTSVLESSNIPCPGMLVASTRSHDRLNHFQQEKFNTAVFASEKSEVIRKKLINLINNQLYSFESHRNNTDPQHAADWSDIEILVVDDNEISLRLADIILSKNRANVTTARSGEQAIDIARNKQFQLVFMDLHMPGLDGFDTAKQIRKIQNDTVIIALTANIMPQDTDKINEAGMNDVLIKPVSNRIMHNIINRWVYRNDKSQLNAEHTPPDTNDSNEIFSLEVAKEFTGGNESLALELFSMLQQELDDYTSAIKENVSNNNIGELRKVIHKLHGASRCCGTLQLKNISSELESLINNGIDFDLNKQSNLLLDAIYQVKAYELTDS